MIKIAAALWCRRNVDGTAEPVPPVTATGKAKVKSSPSALDIGKDFDFFLKAYFVNAKDKATAKQYLTLAPLDNKGDREKFNPWFGYKTANFGTDWPEPLKTFINQVEETPKSIVEFKLNDDEVRRTSIGVSRNTGCVSYVWNGMTETSCRRKNVPVM